MADDTTLRKPGEGAPKEAGKETIVQPERSDKNSDSSKELENLKAESAKRQAETEKEIADLKFENGFKDVVSKYPHASELKDKIQERVRAGMSIDEAAVVLLHGEGKLQTRQEIESQAAGAASLGGSADFQPPKGTKKPEEMTTEELRAALVQEEAKGNFKLIDN